MSNENYDNDPMITSTATTEPPARVPSVAPRMRAVYLQRLDTNLSGTGELVPHAEAAKMNLIWELNQVRFPLTDLVKTPRPEDIHALRQGIRQGIFQNAIVRQPVGTINTVGGAILLMDRTSGEHYSYHPDYIDEESCDLTAEEKLDGQMFLVFLKGEDLPTYLFWQNNDDTDPTEGLYMDRSQLVVLAKLVRQSVDRFERLERYLNTDATIDNKVSFAEKTFAATSDTLGRLRHPMARDVAKKVRAAGQSLNTVGLGLLSEPPDLNLGQPFFDVPDEREEDDDEASDDSSLLETSYPQNEQPSTHEQYEKEDDDETSDNSSLLETSFPPYEQSSADEQYEEDDGIDVYPDGTPPGDHDERDDDEEGEPERTSNSSPMEISSDDDDILAEDKGENAEDEDEDEDEDENEKSTDSSSGNSVLSLIRKGRTRFAAEAEPRIPVSCRHPKWHPPRYTNAAFDGPLPAREPSPDLDLRLPERRSPNQHPLTRYYQPLKRKSDAPAENIGEAERRRKRWRALSKEEKALEKQRRISLFREPDE